MSSHQLHSDESSIQSESHTMTGMGESSTETSELYERPPNPLGCASLYSQLTFSWPLPLIRKGVAKEITEKNIPEIMPEEDSDRNRRRFEEVWNEELRLSAKQGRSASLHRALLKLYYRTLWYVQPAIAMTSMARIGQALALGQLIEFFNGDCETHVKWEGYMKALLLISCTLVPLITHHQAYFRTWRMGMQLRIGAVSAIYHKSLRLVAVGGCKGMSAGEMSNLTSNDVERFLFASLFISYMFWAPVEALAVLFVGVSLIGPAFAAGYLVLFAFVPMQFYLGHRFATYRSQIAKITDQRVSLVSQAIQGVRVMKMNGWELQFSERINKLRGEEVNMVQAASRYRAMNEAIFYATNVSVAIVVFVVHVLTGHELTTHDVFVTLTLINVVQFTMTKFFAYSVMSCSECYVSVQRIQQFLELPEMNNIPCEVDGGPVIALLGVSCYWDSRAGLSDNGDSLESRNLVTHRSAENTSVGALCSFQSGQSSDNYNSEPDRPTRRSSRHSVGSEVTLQNVAVDNVSLQLERGRLYCLIGPVGCGKSALLLTLAGELEPSRGSIQRRATSLAYAAQTAWIMDGTLRENVLMGREFDSAKYDEIIDACGLRPDIARFHSGDQTLLGDRGIQCSGGQQARIGLARALYTDAELVLLDDPLSAVDSKVARLMFQSAIQDLCLARGKCVVLATHQYQLIEKEQCILMKRGRVVLIAPFQNCIQQSEGLLESSGKSAELSTSAEFADDVYQEKVRPILELNNTQRNSNGNDANSETKETGALSTNTWKNYVQAMGGKWVVAGILSLFAFTQCTLLVTIAFIGRWAQRPFEEQSSPTFLSVILSLGFGIICLSVLRSFLAFSLTINASRRLHDDMTLAVLRAKVEFFDTNPLGRILNRFSADIGSNDDQLPTSLNDTVSIGFLVVGAIIAAAFAMPIILFAVPPIFCYFSKIRRMFIAASRELKRFEGIARSPIHGMMSESMTGISSIRANGGVEYFKKRFALTQNAHSRAFFSFISCTRWLNFRLESIQLTLLSVACLLAVLIDTELWVHVDPAMFGLSLTLLLQLSGLLQWAVRQSCEVISNMIAVERVAAYGAIEPEAPLETETDKLVDAHWPRNGSLGVKDLAVRYRKSLPQALSHLTFEVQGGERIAVVGRTGSGKSTLLQALFRLLEAEDGSIEIDGKDVSKLGLHMLRKRMSVIPQAPVLFSGWSLRDNLDPFRKYSDEEIIESIINVQLQDIYVELPAGLETTVADNGSNFSVGQRQLLCVARAMLQKNKLVVLDEPTANVDPRTDALLQKAISTCFPGATVIAIAHRLETIIDYDRILVVGDGKMLEFGSPSQLLLQDGAFAAMVADTGKVMASLLHNRAFARSEVDSVSMNMN